MARIVSQQEISNGIKLSTFAPVYRIDSETIVKTGKSVRMAEAETMKFVAANTTIPVPKVHNAYHDENTGNIVIVMDFIKGENLDKAWHGYTDEEQESVIAQLWDCMDQLHSFKGDFIGSIGGSACNDQYFYDEREGYGPFKTEAAFNQGVTRAMKKNRPYNFVDLRCDVWNNVMHDHEFVLTHGDFDPRNILVHGTKVVAILDWEFAGFYPEYWEYCKAISCPDWEHPWSKCRAVERIMKPWFKEVSVFWGSSEVMS